MSNEISVTLEEVQEQIKLGEMLDTLHKNRAFRTLILEQYFEKEAYELVKLKAHPMNEMQKELIDNKMIGISALQNYFRGLYAKAESASDTLKEYEQAQQEMITEE